MFNTGQYFFKTSSRGTVASRMYHHILTPDYFHAGKFETMRTRDVQNRGFRPGGALVKQVRSMHLLKDF
jgi:hypothetical protein